MGGESYTPEATKIIIDQHTKELEEIKTEVKTLSDFKYTVSTLSATVDKLTKSVDKLNEERYKPAMRLSDRIGNLKFNFIDKVLWLICGAFLTALLSIVVSKINF